MTTYTNSKIRYFSIRKNVAGATTYDIKMKLRTTLDPQIGSTTEPLVGKDITYGERTNDGGGEFKGTIKATGSGKGGYIKVKTLKSLLGYKGQIKLLSLSELEYSGTYIVTETKYT